MQKKINPHSFFLFVLYIPFLCGFILTGCTSNEVKDNESRKEVELVAFNRKEIDKLFKPATDSEQWFLIADIIKSSYKNKDEVKDWLNEKLHFKTKNTLSIDADFYVNLMYDTYKADFNEEARFMAYFALYSEWGRMFIQNKDIAALILSDYYNRTHEIDSLDKYNNILKNYIQSYTNDIIPINYHLNQAVIEEKKGDFFQSVVQNYKALEFIKETDSVNLGIVYHNLAVTYLNLEHFDKALENLNLSLTYEPVDDISLFKLNTAGIIYSKSKAYKEAEEIFQKAISKAKKESQNILLAQSYSNYGNLKRKKKEFNTALEYMNISDSLCSFMGLNYGILINLINRAEVYLDQGLYKMASDELEKARQSIENINDVKLNKEFYNLYYRIQDAIGNKAEANFYYRLYNENKNEYFGDLSKTIIVEWQLENQKNQALKKESEYELSLEKKNRDILFISFLLLLAALASVITYFVLFRRNVREKKELELEKQKMAYELEIKSKELLADTIKNISISSLKNNIYVELTSIVKELPKTHQNKLTNLANKIKQTRKLSELDEFNKRFTQIYEGFYHNLREIAPDITPNELKICALIRLNLTSKEIALLTNRTERTVENIRVNIRKKLKLSPESNLQQELWNIN